MCVTITHYSHTVVHILHTTVSHNCIAYKSHAVMLLSNKNSTHPQTIIIERLIKFIIYTTNNFNIQLTHYHYIMHLCSILNFMICPSQKSEV